MRVVLDTNVLVSSYLSASGPSGRIRAAFQRQEIEVVVSDALLEEYRRVLNYPRIVKLHGMSSEEIDDQIAGLREAAIFAPLAEIPDLIPEDPPDNDVIATAVSGEAEYIISGDDDLQRVGMYQGIRVVTPALFAALLQSRELE
jgi:putative PIN family toxin of toxin-antitoxin system